MKYNSTDTYFYLSPGTTYTVYDSEIPSWSCVSNVFVGIETLQNIDRGPGLYTLNIGTTFVLPKATGSSQVYKFIVASDVTLTDPCFVQPQTGEYVNGEQNPTLQFDTVNNVYHLIDVGTGTWILRSYDPGNTATNRNIYSGIAGMVCAFAMSSAPTGWLIADGAEVSKTTYAGLKYNNIYSFLPAFIKHSSKSFLN